MTARPVSGFIERKLCSFVSTLKKKIETRLSSILLLRVLSGGSKKKGAVAAAAARSSDR